jgi:hypothetical protein
MLTLWEVSQELSLRLSNIFLKDAEGRRAVYGNDEKFQTDENWRDHILFYEYFHGDKGCGLGASHQTGWTGLIGKLLQQAGEYAREESGKFTETGEMETAEVTNNPIEKYESNCGYTETGEHRSAGGNGETESFRHFKRTRSFSRSFARRRMRHRQGNQRRRIRRRARRF